MNIICVCLLVAMATFAKASSPEEGDMFEGDMILSPDQMAALQEQNRKKNSFASIKASHWKDKNGKPDVIKFYVDKAISKARGVILEAVAEYQKHTCIRFQELGYRPTNEPHLYFATGRGCSSPVGRWRSGNRISLATGCWTKGIVMHEMGHSLGFYHEQSRPDRDNYVYIHFENINPGSRFNFNKYTTDTIDSLGTPYDYESLMHYGKKYFTTDWNKLTIQTHDPTMQDKIGQRKGFSKGDIIQLNKMYCNGSGTGSSSCQDTDNGCKDWKSFCSYDPYTIKHCKKTCGKC